MSHLPGLQCRPQQNPGAFPAYLQDRRECSRLPGFLKGEADRSAPRRIGCSRADRAVPGAPREFGDARLWRAIPEGAEPRPRASQPARRDPAHHAAHRSGGAERWAASLGCSRYNCIQSGRDLASIVVRHHHASCNNERSTRVQSSIARPLQAVTATLAAAMAAQLVAEGNTNLLPPILIVIALATAATGILLCFLGLSRTGRAIRFIPYPVIGGFLGATGWLMILGAIQVITDQRLTLATIGEFSSALNLSKVGAGLTVAAVLHVLLNGRGRGANVASAAEVTWPRPRTQRGPGRGPCPANAFQGISVAPETPPVRVTPNP